MLRVAARGYRVLLAHPERNPTLQRNPRRLATLLEHGTLVQVTAGALLGPRSSRSRRLATALMQERQAHVLASDRHGVAIKRTGLRDGVEAADREIGAYARWMVTDAPAAILAGAPLPPTPSPRGRGGRGAVAHSPLGRKADTRRTSARPPPADLRGRPRRSSEPYPCCTCFGPRSAAG